MPFLLPPRNDNTPRAQWFKYVPSPQRATSVQMTPSGLNSSVAAPPISAQ
jgi:hypothetical protein